MNPVNSAVLSFEEIFHHVLVKLQHWKSAFFLMLPNMLVALLILSLFFVLANYAKRFSRGLFARFTRNTLVVSFLSNILWLTLDCIGIIAALGVLHLDKTVTSILAGAGILGLAVSFAFQDIVSNFISGLLITFYKPFEVGDDIKTKDFMGHVVSINLRNTVIDTVDGERVLVPNKDVVQSPLTNYSVTGQRRISLQIKSPQDMRLDELKRHIDEEVRQLSSLSTREGTQLHLAKIAEDGFHFQLSFWLRSASLRQNEELRTQTLMTLVAALQKRGLKITTP